MNFNPGDQVVHWAYGLGEILQLDEKKLLGKTEQYYVVQIGDLTLWVPVNTPGESSLRNITPAEDFESLYQILSAPAEPLPDDRLQRKTHLSEMMKDGSLASVCRVVRDINEHIKTKKLNENDSQVLERALTFLLNEWAASLSISLAEAKKSLAALLGDEIFRVKAPSR